MTEKDMQSVEYKLERALAMQSKLFDEQFKSIRQILESNQQLNTEKLNTIDRKVTITNGTVAEQAKRIESLKEENSKHYSGCPNSADIKDLKGKVSNLQMMEVGRDAVSKFTWKQITGMGIIIGIVFTILNFVIKFI